MMTIDWTTQFAPVFFGMVGILVLSAFGILRARANADETKTEEYPVEAPEHREQDSSLPEAA